MTHELSTAATAPAPSLLAVLAGMTAEASDDAVTVAELLAAPDTPFVAMGLGSLAQLRLVDAVEARYGVFLDLDQGDFLGSLDALAAHLTAEHGVARQPVAEHGADEHEAAGVVVAGHAVAEHAVAALATGEDTANEHGASGPGERG
ncbi:phosphopantetheine-binding protein [Streptomyces sp. NPDC021224]|uniref:phosphopantetheine-binding protein n=1 Tax=unclassified Streptomyces TaxID=2593676 RepID=UPI0037BD8E99